MEHWRENGLNSKLQETPAQVLSCEYCDNFKNNYFEKDLERAASLNPLSLVRYSKKQVRNLSVPFAMRHLSGSPFCKNFFLRAWVPIGLSASICVPVGKNLCKIKGENIRATAEFVQNQQRDITQQKIACSKSAIETLEIGCCSGVFLVKSEHIRTFF